MRSRDERYARVFAFIVGMSVAALTGVTMAQQGPVAAMFADDQKRNASLAQSFTTAELPATSGASVPLQRVPQRRRSRAGLRRIRIPSRRDDCPHQHRPADRGTGAGDPARADRSRSETAGRHAEPGRPGRSAPATGVSTNRRRAGPPSHRHRFVRGAPGAGRRCPAGAFPKAACLVATDFANGGAVDRRELFLQDRMRQGISAASLRWTEKARGRWFCRCWEPRAPPRRPTT